MALKRDARNACYVLCQRSCGRPLDKRSAITMAELFVGVRKGDERAALGAMLQSGQLIQPSLKH